MLNFKKGLAMVLAAATALTFAPVANLGSVIDANAAVSEVGVDMSTFWDQTQNGGKGGFYKNHVVSSGAVNSDTDCYQEFDGITVQKTVKGHAGDVYKIASQDGVEVLSVNGQTDNLTSADTTKLPEAPNSGNLVVKFKIKKVTGGSFYLVDMTLGNYTYDQIHVKVTNNNSLTGEDTSAFDPVIKDVTISKTAGTNDDKVDDKNTSHYVTTGTSSSQTNADGTKQYTLTLNNNNGSYYAIGATSNSSYVSWTGVSTTKCDDPKATSVSGGVKWMNPDSGTGSMTTTLFKTTSASNSTSRKNIFSVTTANAAENYIDVYFVAHDLGDTSKTVTVSKKLKYVVDRSNNAVDWLKWNDKTYSKANNNLNITDSDSFKLTDTQTLDPYINTTATILVKSESKDITFVSSDSTIASVQKDASKYYKATVTAHKAGTVTISVYVGGTNNNKGKVILIPVSVGINATDSISVSDAAGLYGAEEADTIFLDAADSTATNAVKSVKLNIVSKGGNAWDKLESDDTSVATLSADGTLTATAKNVDANSPKIAHLNLVTKDNLANHITSGSKTVTVVVWGKPAANFTIDDVYLNLSNPSQRTKTIETKPALSNVAYSVISNGNSDDLDSDSIFTLTNPSTSANTQTTATVIGRAVGTGKIKALVTETAKTRPTAKIVKVTVGADNANVITADKDYLTLTEGETAQINAKATAGTVTFASADPTIASVTTGGAVTAVKSGNTKITVSAEGATSVVIPVFVAPKQVTPADTATKPAKVTGVKITNKKGGFVTVTWNKQDQKNIKYYVKKTVGKKSSGKSVNGGKTTLTVKKGATVKVKVKAYVYDATGKKLVGTYSKTVTKKTDKK